MTERWSNSSGSLSLTRPFNEFPRARNYGSSIDLFDAAIIYARLMETVVSFRNGKNIPGGAILGERGKIKLRTLPKVPSNAVVVHLNPPLYLQVTGKHLLLTRGAFWIDEPLRDSENELFTVSREDNKFIVGFKKNIELHACILVKGKYELHPLNKDEPTIFIPIDAPFQGLVFMAANCYISFSGNKLVQEITKVSRRGYENGDFVRKEKFVETFENVFETFFVKDSRVFIPRYYANAPLTSVFSDSKTTVNF